MRTLGFAMCGSFCTLSRAISVMEELSTDYSILPIMSGNTYSLDTKFGNARDFIKQAEMVSGKPVLHTIVEVEPVGPQGLVDAMLVAPCTGNTLSKIANGITDTSVTMAVKSSLRIGIPVILCIASNDAIGGSGQNLIKLINTKNVYVVPLSQDDPVKKPLSLVSDFSVVGKTVEAALQGRQLQPIYSV